MRPAASRLVSSRLAWSRPARRIAPLLAALLLGACVGRGAPRTSVDPEKATDTCQHTMEGGQARTVCF